MSVATSRNSTLISLSRRADTKGKEKGGEFPNTCLSPLYYLRHRNEGRAEKGEKKAAELGS